jgi:hypothetical protein
MELLKLKVSTTGTSFAAQHVCYAFSNTLIISWKLTGALGTVQ